MASYPVSVRRVHDFVIGFLQIPPCDGHPCLDGWFRSSRSMGDFHPLNASHTEHTRRKRLSHLPAERSLLHMKESYLFTGLHSNKIDPSNSGLDKSSGF